MGTHLVNIVLVFIFGSILLNRFGVFGWGSLPPVKLEASPSAPNRDPCSLSERCVIAYVAPWCPSCQSSVPFLNALNKKLIQSTKVGMKVIVGMADKSDLEKMSDKFSAPVFYDIDGEFASQVGISSVPSVLLTESSGKILDKGLPGSISGLRSEDENIAYYIKNILGISELM